MPGGNFVVDKGYMLDPAADNASATTYAAGYPQLFSVVKQTGGAQGAQPLIQRSTASGEKCLGVIQEDVPAPGDPKSLGLDYNALGRVVNVRLMGLTRVLATGTIAAFSRVISNGDGTVVIAATATANQNIVGIALGAAVSTGDQIDLLLTPGVQANNP